MLRTRFLWKLYAGYALLILLTITIVWSLIGIQIEKDERDVERERLRDQAVDLAEWIREIAIPSQSGGIAYDRLAELQARLRRKGDLLPGRFTVLDPQGTVLADSARAPESLDNHGDRPEIIAARKEGWGTSKRFSDSLEEDAYYYALRVEDDEGRLLGYSRTSVASKIADERLGRVRAGIVFGAVLAIVVAAVLAIFVGRRIVAPLKSVTAAAASIAGGDYRQRVKAVSTDEIGELARAFNSMADELEHRMETITRDRNKLSTILGGMVEGVVAIDLEERIVHMNDVAGMILGVRPAESVGKPALDVIKIEDISSALIEALHEAREVKNEIRLIERSRGQVLELTASPLRDGDDRLTGAVVVVHEVTELRRLESIRRDFVANVSHELKTPITAIRGLAETLEDDKDIPEETRNRFLRKIKNQALRLSTLATDLLTLARLESEEGVMESKPLDVREPLVGSTRSLVQEGEDLGVQVEFRVPDKPAMVRGDEQALRMVFSNLLDNALKYTPEGGHVWIRLESEDRHAVIEVQDTGIGIEPEEQRRIFERFYRVDKARSRELGGTGLGLSIVKHACLVHGGQVSVESTPGEGSTFRVRLPLVR